MLRQLVISGPDGAGKSTQCSLLREQLERNLGLKVEQRWQRHMRVIAKVFNGAMLLTGRNRKVRYSWGVIGYHDYQFSLGILYIFLCRFDWTLFSIAGFLRDKVGASDIILNDRHLPDLIVDLVLATGRYDLVINIFKTPLTRFCKRNEVVILNCDPSVAKSRRPDLMDDEIYDMRSVYYSKVAREFNIPQIYSSDGSVAHTSETIFQLFDNRSKIDG